MGIIAAYALPHPPLIIPAVGKGEERAIQETIDAMDDVAARIAAHKPDTVVIISPHSPLYKDGFFVSDAIEEIGTMAQFRAPDEQLGVLTDLPFAVRLSEVLDERRLPTAGLLRKKGTLDHASFIPLYFLQKAMPLDDVRVVRMGISGLPAVDHEFVGEALARVAKEQNKRVVIIASGDWSHKLTADGPYGFVPEGPKFDAAVADIFREGTLSRLYHLDEALCEEAAECGLRSFWIMAGALKGQAYECELLSYEGPFGVGYGVAACEVIAEPDSTEAEVEQEIARTYQKQMQESDEAQKEASGVLGQPGGPDTVYQQLVAQGEDPLVALARQTVETFVRTRQTVRHPDSMPGEYLHRQAGVFVSLHENDDLRGCIGTIFPIRSCIADEVIRNGVAAACEDPRFRPVMPDELPWLTYSVDVLDAPEPVNSLEELDPKRYGIIVTRGRRRGLLLPDLEGVDTVEEQIAIAKRKAGIAPFEDVDLERFEVIRHAQKVFS